MPIIASAKKQLRQNKRKRANVKICCDKGNSSSNKK